jgi:hypothetical protein
MNHIIFFFVIGFDCMGKQDCILCGQYLYKDCLLCFDSSIKKQDIKKYSRMLISLANSLSAMVDDCSKEHSR